MVAGKRALSSTGTERTRIAALVRCLNLVSLVWRGKLSYLVRTTPIFDHGPVPTISSLRAFRRTLPPATSRSQHPRAESSSPTKIGIQDTAPHGPSRYDGTHDITGCENVCDLPSSAAVIPLNKNARALAVIIEEELWTLAAGEIDNRAISERRAEVVDTMTRTGECPLRQNAPSRRVSEA